MKLGVPFSYNSHKAFFRCDKLKEEWGGCVRWFPGWVPGQFPGQFRGRTITEDAVVDASVKCVSASSVEVLRMQKKSLGSPLCGVWCGCVGCWGRTIAEDGVTARGPDGLHQMRHQLRVLERSADKSVAQIIR